MSKMLKILTKNKKLQYIDLSWTHLQDVACHQELEQEVEVKVDEDGNPIVESQLE
jgi:hypothetical protein